MEFLKTIRRRSFVSEVIYIGLNVALAVAVLIAVRATESPVPAFALVALSKWRVFAVRPRYWLANIQANLVDFIVSISTVLLLLSANANPAIGIVLQVILTVLYIGWLVIIKPRSVRRAVVLQAAIALFMGVTALYVVSYAWNDAWVVLIMGIIGYVTARHVLTQYEEDHLQFLSLLWALVLAQIGWVAAHWTIAYEVPLLMVRIPQVSIIVLCLAVVVFKAYDTHRRTGAVRLADISLPLLFSCSIIAILLVLYNRVETGAI